MNLADPNPKFIQIRRTLRFVWLALVFSMGWVSYVLFKVMQSPPPFNPLFPLLAGLMAFLSFAVPGFLGRRLAGVPGADPLDAKLGNILVTHILRFAFTEAALIILLISNPYPSPGSSLTYFGAAFVLMIFHFPSNERLAKLM